VVDLDTAFDQQLFHVPIGKAVARYHHTATTITLAENRKAAKAEPGGDEEPRREDSFTGQGCPDLSSDQRNSPVSAEAGPGPEGGELG
jgi:hypothetical protein